MTTDLKNGQFEKAVVMKIIEQERRRCVGILLSEYATWKLSGEERIANVIDALATKLEHPENV